MSGQDVTLQDNLVMVGQIVSERYEITKHLGTGGFAKVFKAFDMVIEREVAIKFLDLRAIHGSDQMINTILERFRREAKLAAKIHHRNVVNIHDIGQLDERGFRPFIVMELLNGHDLEDQLNDHGPIAPERLIPLYVDCLDALGEAHALGIVHKDLKPSNLFLSNPGERSEAVRIVDFGIAHIKNSGQDPLDEDEKDAGIEPGRGGRLTATGQILGTLQYLTPEYIASQIVTPALDVYQMALILVELLSGERVIKTDNPFECLRIHTFGLLELPEYLLDSPLGPVLRKGLEAEHEERYQNAAEFADALSKVDASTIPASPLLAGSDRVVTSQFQRTNSSPALPTNNTANFSKPSTGELKTEPSLLDTIAPSEEFTASLRDEIDDLRGENRTQMRADAGNKRMTSLSHVDDDFQDPEQDSKKGLVLIAGAVIFGILAALGGVVYLINADKNKEPADPVVIAAKEDPPEIKETTPTIKETTPVIKETTPPIADLPEETTPTIKETTPPVAEKVVEKKKKKPTSHRVRVVSEPANARIKLGGRSCSNPCPVRIAPRDFESREIIVSADGYTPRQFKANRDDEGTITVRLTPKPSALLKEIKKDPPKDPPDVIVIKEPDPPKETTPPEKKKDPANMGILN